MKCPKCGSSYIRQDFDNSKFKCVICLHEWKVSPELTTAEMLLWLAENCTRFEISTLIYDSIFVEFSIRDKRFNFIKGTTAEAIKQAYEWARKEEQNAKN